MEHWMRKICRISCGTILGLKQELTEVQTTAEHIKRRVHNKKGISRVHRMKRTLTLPCKINQTDFTKSKIVCQRTLRKKRVPRSISILQTTHVTSISWLHAAILIPKMSVVHAVGYTRWSSPPGFVSFLLADPFDPLYTTLPQAEN